MKTRKCCESFLTLENASVNLDQMVCKMLSISLLRVCGLWCGSQSRLLC